MSIQVCGDGLREQMSAAVGQEIERATVNNGVDWRVIEGRVETATGHRHVTWNRETGEVRWVHPSGVTHWTSCGEMSV